MALPEKEDGLSALNKKLYARDAPETRVGHAGLSSHSDDTRHDWDLPAVTKFTRPRRLTSWWSISLLTKVFFAAVGFFILAAGLAAVLIFRGSNIVSNANIDIAVTSPVAVKSGDFFDLGIAVTNKNRSDLETADLIIEYPPGTRDSQDPNKDLTRLRVPLGSIKSGQTIIHSPRVILFGQEQSRPEIRLALEYRLTGSNAIFEKIKSVEVLMSDSPVSINLELPAEQSAGKPVTVAVEVIANSPTILKNVALLGSWPPGFELTNSSLPGETLGVATIWRLGDLSPGGRRRFTVTGNLIGQDEELKVFRFQAGLLADPTDRSLAVVYTDTFKNLLIKRPFVGLALIVNDDSGREQAARLGETLQVQIDWGNNLPVDVTDGRLELSFQGEILNRSSVAANPGFYHSADNLIVWDGVSVPGLALLRPGDRGRVQFSFASQLFSDTAAIRNPTLILKLIFRGRQAAPGRPGEPVETEITKILKLESAFGALARLLYHDGPFENTGPIPPRADQETTYTVILAVSAGANEVSGAKIRAILPPYVRWLGEVSPGTEKVSWNETAREIIWDAGYLPVGAKGEARTRQVAIRLAVRPSVSQIGRPFNVLEQIMATGIDTFTGTALERRLDPVDSRFSTDSGFRANDDRVAP